MKTIIYTSAAVLLATLTSCTYLVAPDGTRSATLDGASIVQIIEAK